MLRFTVLKAIVRKDISETLKSKAVLIPLTIVPLIFMVLLPLAIGLVPRYVELSAIDQSTNNPLNLMLTNLPDRLKPELETLTYEQQFIILISHYAIAPLFLIIPLMVASIFSANSFAGELERKTLEALLYTPTTDRELFAGKFGAALVPAIAVAWLGFLLFTVTINSASWSVMKSVFFPPLSWLIILLWVVPAVAGLGSSVLILISARTKNFMEAQQIGGVLVVPFLGLLAMQLTGVLYLDSILALALGAGFWTIDLVILAYGAKTFSRSSIITRV